MKKDLKGLRISKRIWGRLLSFTLAGVLTVSSCYFAPARAIADDEGVTAEAAAPVQEVQQEAPQPVEETPAAVEEAPAADTGSEEAVVSEAPAGEGIEGQTGEAPAEGAEVQPGTGEEGTAVDPVTGEVIDPEQDPLATEEEIPAEGEEDPEKKDDEEKKEESVFTTTISLIFQMGQ